DYWSDTVRRSILLDSKADLLVYGMGEKTIVEIARRLAAGETVKDLRDLRGVAYVLGAKEAAELASGVASAPRVFEASGVASAPREFLSLGALTRPRSPDYILLPSFEDV